MMEAVLNTDPGSSRSLTAWLAISLYSPSSQCCMLTMALMSPVATSMTIATPTFPPISFSSSTTDRSARSCMLTSIVVTTSDPFSGGTSVMDRNLLRTIMLWPMPSLPRSTESKAISSPHRGTRPPYCSL